MRAEDKDRALVEVIHRVMEVFGVDSDTIEHALFDTIYDERQRVEGEKDRELAHKQGAFYDKLQKKGLRASPARQRELLKRIVDKFANEIVGHFDERVYNIATRVLPPSLNILLNALSPLRLMQGMPEGFSGLSDQVLFTGATEQAQNLAKKATLIMVPTHASNLDSLVLGFGIYRLGLPPFLYGAGLNLFANKLMGFFMHNLGAYTVDRRKRARVYKEVLKRFAGVSLELGYHNLFFPGGTRSRSGAIEKKLKLGLTGMGLDAYIHNLKKKSDKPDIFIIPATINYQLVLEAETLIDDHLKDVGKGRYIIEDDEFSRPKQVLDFISKLFSLNSKIHVVLGEPLDVFGNKVDENGDSHDDRGRLIDRRRYVTRDGQPVHDRQRDQEYTRELSVAIADSYQRNTMLKSVNILAYVAFDLLKKQNPGMDLYRLLRTGGKEDSLDLADIYEQMDKVLQELRDLQESGELLLDPVLEDADAQSVVAQALSHFASYHTHPALRRRGDRLFHEDRNLLLFYQNRLNGYELSD